MIKVSIIMPIYNSEKYVSKAIESVLAQKFDGFELILVNDGSTDNSGEICDKYAEKDERVKVIHKENGGICTARNMGIEIARGEYIGFCDNDDVYLPGLIEDNYTLAKQHNVDLMRYGKIKRVEKEDGSVWEIHTKIRDMFIDEEEFSVNYQNIRREDTVWTAFYRKAILDEYKIRFDVNFLYGSEDHNFNLLFLMHCKRLGFNSKEYYLWTQRDSHSTSRKFRREWIEKNMYNMDLEYQFMEQVCGGNVENVMKNIFLVNSYVYPLIDYMSMKTSTMTLKEKEAYLARLRKHPLFDKEIPKTTLQKVRKENVRVYITMKLFYEKKFRCLIRILNSGSAILAKFRFKKGTKK